MIIYRYFISIILIGSSIFGFAQESKTKDAPERQFFVRAGVDLSRLALPFIEDYEYLGFEAFMDTEIKYKLFPTMEAGWNKVSDQREDYNYESNGVYARLGANYNLLKYKHRLDRNLFFVGARYAVSVFEHKFSNVIIANEWDQYNVDIPASKHTVQWIEGVIGLRAEIVKNLYMGYTIRVKVLTTRNEFEKLKPYIIPGYGEGYKTTTVGMSYTISYAIPIKNVTIDYGTLKP